jgi:glycosyltransferase involved in cell wall biosynthesis
LYVLGDASLPVHQYQPHDSSEILRFARPVENFLERALGYGAYLERILAEASGELQIVQFRDPWGGVPLLSRPHRYASVYEVNALPSIELPHAFPGIAPRTLEKLRADERFCLEQCDVIVTPSHTTAKLIETLGIARNKLHVIPNGADIPRTQTHARPSSAPEHYLIYFGAMQSWQGIDTLLRAFSRLADLESLQLIMCGSRRSREARRAERFADKLGLTPRMQWHWQLSAAELTPWVAHADLSIAPLRECARNVVQGCAPLKILESMACGVPVIASDLPPVRELLCDGREGRLIAPDRPAELARAIRVLMAYPEQRKTLGARARERVAQEFTWDAALMQLRALYRAIDPARMSTRAVTEPTHLHGQREPRCSTPIEHSKA